MQGRGGVLGTGAANATLPNVGKGGPQRGPGVQLPGGAVPGPHQPPG